MWESGATTKVQSRRVDSDQPLNGYGNPQCYCCCGEMHMHFKRPKTKRRVRCTICTPHRWQGNNKNRFKTKEEGLSRTDKKEIRSLLGYSRIELETI